MCNMNRARKGVRAGVIRLADEVGEIMDGKKPRPGFIVRMAKIKYEGEIKYLIDRAVNGLPSHEIYTVVICVDAKCLAEIVEYGGVPVPGIEECADGRRLIFVLRDPVTSRFVSAVDLASGRVLLVFPTSGAEFRIIRRARKDNGQGQGG